MLPSKFYVTPRDDSMSGNWYLSKFPFYWFAAPKARVSCTPYNVRGLGETLEFGEFPMPVNFSCETCVYLPELHPPERCT